MTKERKQDLIGPDEEALEQHVHDMLDVNVPDKPEPKTAPTKVPVSFGDGTTQSTESPQGKSAANVELSATIAAVNEQLTGQPATAPLVESPPSAKSKKVVVEHIEADVPPEVPVAQDEEMQPIVKTEAKEDAVSVEDTTPESVTESTDTAEAHSPLDAEIESPATDTAVDDIMAKEGDELLAIQDEHTTPVIAAKPKKRGLRRFFSAWAHSSLARWATFLILFGCIVAASLYPDSRYYLLNKAGVRSSASITIIDQSTLRPLKNVKVTLAGKTAISDENGKATLSELTLGPTDLVIEKRAFAAYSKPMTIGWGSNPLSDISMIPQGTQYVFTALDVLSGKPVAEVEASVGELTATANEKGEIKLTLDKIETDTVTVVFRANGYKETSFQLDLSSKVPQNISLTPSRQVAFISKRTGKYDLYKIDVDGKNEALVLPGTGNESGDIALLAHPTESSVALIASRTGTHTTDGRLLTDLTYISLKDGETKSVISSTQIRAISWIGTRLAYVVLNDEAGADDPNRYRLMSYDFVSGDNRQLAAANYFNSVTTLANKIYYAPASVYQDGVNLGVFEVHADGSGKRALLDLESWNMIRTDYDTLTIAVQQDWYKYSSGDSKPQKLSGQPGDTTSRVYVSSPDSKHSAWIDSRDGKGVIVVYDTAKKSEAVLAAQGGITGPIRWLNNTTLVYRLSTNKETADYVMSIEGGVARKISDVTNTAGIDRWSY